jgi:pSer/pThr/pTyr-binding forkhead associated (FHA) protein
VEVKLSVLTGMHQGRKIRLPETIFLIGRGSECHLRPHCQGVSKLHCAIAAWAGKVRLRDLKSRNKTYLNGEAIEGEVVVRDGDELQVGSLRFAFELTDDGVPRVAPSDDERELEWLLLAPKPDSAVLLPSARTCDLPAVSGGGQETPGSKAVSGGKHLRAYVETRKRQRAGKDAPPGPGA